MQAPINGIRMTYDVSGAESAPGSCCIIRSPPT